MRPAVIIAVTVAFLLLSRRSMAATITAEMRKGSAQRLTVNVDGVVYRTNYARLPIVPNVWTTISRADTIRQIRALGLPDAVGINIYALIVAEAAKVADGFKGLNNNYAGVQTDSGVWGYNNFTGQTARIDSGNVPRMFATFDNFQGFIEFIENRLKAKGFDAVTDAAEWAKRYVSNWWGVPQTPQNIRDKAAIYTSAAAAWRAAR